MSMLHPPNKVPQHQKFYQQQYAQHVRLWKINPRSPFLMVPFQVAMYGTLASSMYMMGRKILGYNTWFGEN